MPISGSISFIFSFGISFIFQNISCSFFSEYSLNNLTGRVNVLNRPIILSNALPACSAAGIAPFVLPQLFPVCSDKYPGLELLLQDTSQFG